MSALPIFEIRPPLIPSGDIYFFTTDQGVEYEVRFGRKATNILQVTVVFGVLNEEYDSEEYVVTNKGELFRVMGTITAVIKMFMEEHPRMISYEFTGEPRTSEGDGKTQVTARTKLFLRFVPRIFGDGWKPYQKGNSVIVARLGHDPFADR